MNIHLEVAKNHSVILSEGLQEYRRNPNRKLSEIILEASIRSFPNQDKEYLKDWMIFLEEIHLVEFDISQLIPRRLDLAISTFRMDINQNLRSVPDAQKQLSSIISAYTKTEQGLAHIYCSVYVESIRFWRKFYDLEDENNDKGEDIRIQTKAGPVSSSHYYTDFTCIAKIDAAGAIVGAAKFGFWLGASAAIGPLGAPSATAAAVGIAAAGALASMASWAFDKCNVEVGRENVPVAGGPAPPNPEGPYGPMA